MSMTTFRPNQIPCTPGGHIVLPLGYVLKIVECKNNNFENGDSKIQKKNANLARSACPSRSSPAGFWKKIFLFSATLQKEYFFAKNLDCLRSSTLAKKASFFLFFLFRCSFW